MFVRRSGPLALALLLAGVGCNKSVDQRSPSQTIVVARFASPDIPIPNDLALQAAPTLPDALGAQRTLLQTFITQGGFPADQAPTLSVPLRAFTWKPEQNQYVASTDLPTADAATITATTAALFRVDGDAPQRIDVVPVEPQPPGALSFVPKGDASGKRLPAGRYVFAVRGGDLGVKTTDGQPIAADVPVALTIPNKDLTRPENQPPGGIPDQNGNGSSADELQQLEFIRAALWAPAGWASLGGQWAFCPMIPAAAMPDACKTKVAPAYASIDAAFPHSEIASIAAFQIAPPTGATVVAVDSASGQAPLPFDLLRTGPDGHIALNPAFGPAAEGLTTLDGFSTTAMILAPVITPGSPTGTIDASTVTGATVFLYKLGGAEPELLPELKAVLAAGGNPLTARYVAEPDPIVVKGSPCPIGGGCSSVIGLQPAVNTGLGVHLPALDEKTTYAVVITKGVKDVAGNSIGRPTLMQLLLDPNPLANPGAQQSLVGGLDYATAAMLQQMRADLAPVLAAVPGGKDNVALAYTFKTQSVTGTAMQIAGLPYSTNGIGAVAGMQPLDAATVAAQYGVDPAALPASAIAGFAEVKLTTLSLLLGSQNGGAFDQAHATPEVVTALVALPNPARVTGSCPAWNPAYSVTKCAPLVVFRHAINRSKADLLPIAQALTGAGFVVAAIDAEKHGDRSWCTSDSQCCPAAVCGTASTCAFKANFTGPTDGTTQIGVCESAPGVRGSYLNKKVQCPDPFLSDGKTPNPDCLSPKGVPYISANYLVSLNFFRTRDSLRQDVIDQSAVIKALAPFGPGADAFAQYLQGNGLGYAVDFTKVYWVSQSLGSIQGAVDLAANPRVSNMVFNVPGATLVDIFANPESKFNAALVALLDPIKPGTPQYLQTLQVAKWILDPADPANFAPHVLGNRLASPLDAPLSQVPGAVPGTRSALVQAALCDGTIPNTQNAYFASQLLGQPLPGPGDSSTGFLQWYIHGSGDTCPDGAVPHGFLLDPTTDPTLTGKAQATAAGFLASPSAQPATVR